MLSYLYSHVCTVAFYTYMHGQLYPNMQGLHTHALPQGDNCWGAKFFTIFPSHVLTVIAYKSHAWTDDDNLSILCSLQTAYRYIGHLCNMHMCSRETTSFPGNKIPTKLLLEQVSLAPQMTQGHAMHVRHGWFGMTWCIQMHSMGLILTGLHCSCMSRQHMHTEEDTKRHIIYIQVYIYIDMRHVHNMGWYIEI